MAKETQFSEFHKHIGKEVYVYQANDVVWRGILENVHLTASNYLVLKNATKNSDEKFLSKILSQRIIEYLLPADAITQTVEDVQLNEVDKACENKKDQSKKISINVNKDQETIVIADEEVKQRVQKEHKKKIIQRNQMGQAKMNSHSQNQNVDIGLKTLDNIRALSLARKNKREQKKHEENLISSQVEQETVEIAKKEEEEKKPELIRINTMEKKVVQENKQQLLRKHLTKQKHIDPITVHKEERPTKKEEVRRLLPQTKFAERLNNIQSERDKQVKNSLNNKPTISRMLTPDRFMKKKSPEDFRAVLNPRPLKKRNFGLASGNKVYE